MANTNLPTPRKNTSKRKNRSISFPLSVLKALKEQAKRDNRSVNWLVNAAVAKAQGQSFE